jgi:hypothetical protein
VALTSPGSGSPAPAPAPAPAPGPPPPIVPAVPLTPEQLRKRALIRKKARQAAREAEEKAQAAFKMEIERQQDAVLCARSEKPVEIYNAATEISDEDDDSVMDPSPMRRAASAVMLRNPRHLVVNEHHPATTRTPFGVSANPTVVAAVNSYKLAPAPASAYSPFSPLATVTEGVARLSLSPERPKTTTGASAIAAAAAAAAGAPAMAVPPVHYDTFKTPFPGPPSSRKSGTGGAIGKPGLLKGGTGTGSGTPSAQGSARSSGRKGVK